MDLYSQEIQEKQKDLQNQPQTIKKIATGTIISIFTLNVYGLNVPTEGHRLTEWIQNQDPYMYVVYEKPTSDLKTHIDWKWEDGKYIPCKWEAQESWSSNPHIRQNRPYNIEDYKR